MITESISAPPAPKANVPPAPDWDPDDSSYGWAMFLTFTTAVLAITFAVCALAMVQSWWMLAVVYGVDLAITGLVFKVVFGAFISPAYPALEPAETVAEGVSSEPVKVRLSVVRPTVVAHR